MPVLFGGYMNKVLVILWVCWNGWAGMAHSQEPMLWSLRVSVERPNDSLITHWNTMSLNRDFLRQWGVWDLWSRVSLKGIEYGLEEEQAWIFEPSISVSMMGNNSQMGIEAWYSEDYTLEYSEIGYNLNVEWLYSPWESSFMAAGPFWEQSYADSLNTQVGLQARWSQEWFVGRWGHGPLLRLVGIRSLSDRQTGWNDSYGDLSYSLQWVSGDQHWELQGSLGYTQYVDMQKKSGRMEALNAENGGWAAVSLQWAW